MMHRFERINGVYRLFVATGVSAISVLILDQLQEVLKSRSLAWVVLLGLVAIAVFLLNQAFEGLLEASVTIRKLIAGDEFIEGHWHDISVDRSTKVIRHGCFLTIRWEDGRFALNGTTFDEAGNLDSTFRSTSAAFENGILTFGYQSYSKGYDHAIEIGIDQSRFDRPAQSYSGFYFDFTKTIECRIHGIKVDRETLTKFNHFADLAAKQRFITEKMAEMKRTLGANSPG
jgi:hypothetical protein